MKHIKKFFTISLTILTLFLIASCNTQHEVVFDLDYNNLVHHKTLVDDGEKVKETTMPVRSNYEFLGWYLNDELYNFNNPVKTNLTLLAKWDRLYQIKFYLGYDNTYLDDQIIKENNKVKEPNISNREGYDFLGWFLNDDLYDFSQNVNDDFTLIGKWEKDNARKTFTVKFETNDESLTVDDVLVLEDNYISEPDPLYKEGYNFIGWYLNDSLYNFNTPIKRDLTLIARWKKITYIDITIIGLVEETIKVEKGTTLPLLSNPEKPGHNFDGWYVDDHLYDFESLVNESFTIVAKWTLKAYVTVTINPDDGVSETYTIDVEYGHSLNDQPNLTKEGYKFLGWYKNNTIYDFDLPVYGPFTLTAKFEKIKEEFLIYFIAEGADYVPEQQYVLEGEKVDKPKDPTKENHIFIGWYSRAELFDFDSPIYEDYIITALWFDITNKAYINEFIDAPIDTVKTLSGVITSVALFNYIIVEDASASIKVKVGSFNANQLKDFNIVKGNKITFHATKDIVDGQVVAVTSYPELYNDEIIHSDILKVNLDEVPQNVLITYENRVVTHNDLVVTKIEENNDKLTFTLKRDNEETIKAIYDTRYTFSGYSLLYDIEVLDVVKIDNVVLVYDKSLHFGLDDINQIVKTGEYVDPDDIINFKIYYLNDTHGAVLKNGSEHGLSSIGNYIKKTKDNNSIFITGGDIFQGQVISNYNKGAVMVEIFNHLELDAFVLGNHEFDWGLDVILRFFDNSNSDVKANFPLLAANLVDRNTGLRPEFVDSHTIITRGIYKIGIVGVIGDGQESSIMALKVQDYQFTDAYRAVQRTVNEIKDQVDFILVVNHDEKDEFNTKVSLLPKVSAIFNGHSHRPQRGHKNGVPVIQSDSSGKVVGLVQLDYEKSKSGVNLKSTNMQNVSTHQYLNEQDYEIDQIIYPYYLEVKQYYEDEILNANKTLSRGVLADYLSKLMVKYTNSVFGFQNFGGTRTAINRGPITASDIFKVTPFDNDIVSIEIPGYDLKRLYRNEDNFYLDIDYNSINDYQYYRIVTNDYSFYGSYYNYYFSGIRHEAEFHGNLFDVFHELLLSLREAGFTTFDENSPIIITDASVFNFDDSFNQTIRYYI